MLVFLIHHIVDPLTLLAIVFCALVHDVDHRGVSNSQLAKEEPGLDTRYNGKSLAEQNSLDIAWDILESAELTDLRSALFATDAEKKRFRQVTVNVVLATDIFDRELNSLRKSRWEKAFSTRDSAMTQQVHDLRATIVIEHIIQASDVAHTMQVRPISPVKVALTCDLSLHTPNSTGTSTANGIDACLWKCISLICRDAWLTILPISGTKEKSASSTSTSYLWPGSSRTAVSLVCLVMSVWILPCRIARSGQVKVVR